MTGINEFVVNYIVNATWQITAIALVGAVGAFLLRNAPAHYRHVLWLATLAACLIVPLLIATRPGSAEKSVFTSFEKESRTTTAPVNHQPEKFFPRLTTRRPRVVNASS